MLDQIFTLKGLIYTAVGVRDHCRFMDWTADDSSGIRQQGAPEPSVRCPFDCHYDDSSPVFCDGPAHCLKALKCL